MILLFSCDYLPSVVATNYIVKLLLKYGIKITIISTGDVPNKKQIIPTPNKVLYYGYQAFNECVDPILKSNLGVDAYPLTKIENIGYIYDNVSCIRISDVNSSNSLKKVIQKNDIKGSISIRFNQVFSSEMVNIISKKSFFWNIHGGVLPNYRGLMSVYRAIQLGEKEIGWSVHEIGNKIDSGDIIFTTKLSVNREYCILDYEIALSKIVSKIIVRKILSVINKRDINKINNNIHYGKYFSNIPEDEMVLLENKGVFFSNNLSYTKNIINLLEIKCKVKKHKLYNELVKCINLAIN